MPLITVGGGQPRAALYSKTVEYVRADGARVVKSGEIPAPTGVGTAAVAVGVAALLATVVAALKFGVVTPRYTVEDRVEVYDSRGRSLGQAVTHRWEIEGDPTKFLAASEKDYIGAPVPASLGILAPGDTAGSPRRYVHRRLPRMKADDGIIAQVF